MTVCTSISEHRSSTQSGSVFDHADRIARGFRPACAGIDQRAANRPPVRPNPVHAGIYVYAPCDLPRREPRVRGGASTVQMPINRGLTPAPLARGSVQFHAVFRSYCGVRSARAEISP